MSEQRDPKKRDAIDNINEAGNLMIKGGCSLLIALLLGIALLALLGMCVAVLSG